MSACTCVSSDSRATRSRRRRRPSRLRRESACADGSRHRDHRIQQRDEVGPGAHRDRARRRCGLRQRRTALPPTPPDVRRPTHPSRRCARIDAELSGARADEPDRAQHILQRRRMAVLGEPVRQDERRDACGAEPRRQRRRLRWRSRAARSRRRGTRSTAVPFGVAARRDVGQRRRMHVADAAVDDRCSGSLPFRPPGTPSGQSAITRAGSGIDANGVDRCPLNHDTRFCRMPIDVCPSRSGVNDHVALPVRARRRRSESSCWPSYDSGATCHSAGGVRDRAVEQRQARLRRSQERVERPAAVRAHAQLDQRAIARLALFEVDESLLLRTVRPQAERRTSTVNRVKSGQRIRRDQQPVVHAVELTARPRSVSTMAGWPTTVTAWPPMRSRESRRHSTRGVCDAAGMRPRPSHTPPMSTAAQRPDPHRRRASVQCVAPSARISAHMLRMYASVEMPVSFGSGNGDVSVSSPTCVCEKSPGAARLAARALVRMRVMPSGAGQKPSAFERAQRSRRVTQCRAPGRP